MSPGASGRVARPGTAGRTRRPHCVADVGGGLWRRGQAAASLPRVGMDAGGQLRDVFQALGLGLVQTLAVQDARDLGGLGYGQGHCT